MTGQVKRADIAGGVPHIRPEMKLVYTEAEAARMLDLSTRTMQRFRLEGGGPSFVKLTERRVAYTGAALLEWLDGRSRASTSAIRPPNGGAR